jgi:hypothetical protein
VASRSSGLRSKTTGLAAISVHRQGLLFVPVFCVTSARTAARIYLKMKLSSFDDMDSVSPIWDE